jgi:hypothetical protein
MIIGYEADTIMDYDDEVVIFGIIIDDSTQ